MNVSFGDRFRAWRASTIVPATERQAEHSMTQAEAAEAIGCGLSAVRHYERGRRLPHPIIRRAILTLWPEFFKRVPTSVALQ